MNNVVVQFLVIVLLTLINGIFSASEIAVVSSRRGRLQQRAENGSHGALTALQLAEEPNRFLATVQVGITLISTIAGAFGGSVLATPVSRLLQDAFGLAVRTADTVAFVGVVVLITYLSLILGELVPKRLALKNAEAIAIRIAPFMQFLSRLAAPIVWFLSFSTQAVLHLLGRGSDEEEQVTEEDILSLVREGAQGGTVEASEQELIERVFDFTDATVRSIMTPRTEIVAVSIDTPLDEVVQRVIESGYSRIPVYNESPDEIVGILYAKDLLTLIGQVDGDKPVPTRLAELLREPSYVLEHQRVAEVLQRFKQTRTHIALVLDEYGQIDGLVTMEDVLEELAGDIDDKRDEAEAMVVQRPDGSWLVDGLISYADAEDEINLPSRESLEDLPSFDTIAGLVLALLGHIPHVGESVDWQGWHFEVVDLDGLRIDKVLIRKLDRYGEQAENQAVLASSVVRRMENENDH